MTPKEAIERLRERCTDENFRIGCETHCEEYDCELKEAIAAIEKHRPKRPENWCSIQIFGPVKTFMGNCAVCGYPVNSNGNYCCNCGQAIDWEDNK